MRVIEIMKTNVKTLTPSATVTQARAVMNLNRIHHVVVLKNRQVFGIVSDRDLGGRLLSRASEDRAISDFMTPFPCTATPETTLREAANLMRGRSIGCLPVVDRGRLVGIVTASDLLDLIGRGADRPVARTKRWTLRHRGIRPLKGQPRGRDGARQ